MGTPLHKTALMGRLDVVEHLLSKGPDPLSRTPEAHWLLREPNITTTLKSLTVHSYPSHAMTSQVVLEMIHKPGHKQIQMIGELAS